jgi:hypothetical protein
MILDRPSGVGMLSMNGDGLVKKSKVENSVVVHHYMLRSSKRRSRGFLRERQPLFQREIPWGNASVY